MVVSTGVIHVLLCIRLQEGLGRFRNHIIVLPVRCLNHLFAVDHLYRVQAFKRFLIIAFLKTVQSSVIYKKSYSLEKYN